LLTSLIREKRGFSLIEVLIGIIFLAIGLLAVAGMQATSVRGNFFSNNVMLATYVAQDRLELLKSLPLTSPELTLGSHDDETAPAPLTGSFKTLVFNRAYTVTTPGDGNLSIKYTVTWKDGVNHSLDFYTIRSQ
jgi:prepilin-type N-terminal cleavage/methylation domain-containing protein